MSSEKSALHGDQVKIEAVTVQPRGDRRRPGQWSHGLCGCTSHCGTCVMGSFCPTCLVCQNANGLGESGCLFATLSCFCPCIALTILRGNARSRYNISGGLCGDAVASWICAPCVNCQIANTVKHQH